MLIQKLCFAVVLLNVCVNGWMIQQETIEGGIFQKEVACHEASYVDIPENCRPRTCLRHIRDDFVQPSDVELVRGMVRRALQAFPEETRDLPGPVIFDPDTGFMRHAAIGIVPLHSKSRVEFTFEEYEAYERVVLGVREAINEVFELPSELPYLTMPTFIARIVGDPDWIPEDEHSRYYDVHVDHNNTEHYYYSGLVYLADHGSDFQGGEFRFVDDNGATNHTVLPRRGRLIVFSSGAENTHLVERVETGERMALSLWFTCDPDRRTPSFLDRPPHKPFRSWQQRDL